MKPCTENENKFVRLLFPSLTICLIDYSLPTMRVIVYWEHISLSASSTLSESVITMAQISAGSPLLSRLRRAWKRISGVGCQPIRPWALYPLKANSHSACLNILLNPCPLSPPPSTPFQSPSPLHDCKPQTWTAVQVGLQPERLGRMQVQAGWIVRDEGESSIVVLDSTLSPLEHPPLGEPTDNHAL